MTGANEDNKQVARLSVTQKLLHVFLCKSVKLAQLLSCALKSQEVSILRGLGLSVPVAITMATDVQH